MQPTRVNTMITTITKEHPCLTMSMTASTLVTKRKIDFAMSEAPSLRCITLTRMLTLAAIMIDCAMNSLMTQTITTPEKRLSTLSTTIVTIATKTSYQ